MLDTQFDKIYVVWGGDPARKEYIQDHFNQCNIDNYKFVDSITPDNFFIKKDPKFKNLQKESIVDGPYLSRFKFLREEWILYKCKRQGRNIPMSLAEVCCAYGHLKAYKTAIRDGAKKFLVVEDDIYFDIDLCDNALEWKEYIPDNWDIIHFHSWRPFDSKREPEFANKRVQINDYFYTGYKEYAGAVCCALTENIAKQLLSRFYPIQVAADGVTASLTGTVFARKYYNAYVFSPFLCKQTMFESLIDEEEATTSSYTTRSQRYGMGNKKHGDGEVFDPTVL